MDFQIVVFVLVAAIEPKQTLLGQLVVSLQMHIVMLRVIQTVTLLSVVRHQAFQLLQDIVTVTHKKYIKVWRLRLAELQHKVLDSVGLDAVVGVYHTVLAVKVQ